MRVLFVTENDELSDKVRAVQDQKYVIEAVRSLATIEKLELHVSEDCIICDPKFYSALKMQFESLFLLLVSEENSSDWIPLLESGAGGVIFENCSVEAIFAQINSFVRLFKKGRSMRRFFPRLGLLIDLEQNLIEVQGEILDVTLTELKIIRELGDNDGQVIPRALIAERALRQCSAHNRSLDVHICALRKKLRKYGIDIESIRGVGYRLAHFEAGFQRAAPGQR